MLGSQPSLTKSRQLYHLNVDGGNCELAAPDIKLIHYIDYYWLLTIERPSLVLEVIPDTAVDLVISPDIPGFAALYFPVSEKFSIALQGPVHYAGICFRSARVSDLLQLEFNTLAQLSIGADTIQNLKIEPLLAGIQNTRSINYLTKQFDNYWLSRLDPNSYSSKTQSRISHHELIRALESSVGLDNIVGICTTLGVSDRQFRRLSNDLFGISPKKIQNIMRLQSALNELFQCEQNQIQDLFYDDSHRIRELKRLTGCTPKQIQQMAEKYNKR